MNLKKILFIAGLACLLGSALVLRAEDIYDAPTKRTPYPKTTEDREWTAEELKDGQPLAVWLKFLQLTQKNPEEAKNRQEALKLCTANYQEAANVYMPYTDSPAYQKNRGIDLSKPQRIKPFKLDPQDADKIRAYLFKPIDLPGKHCGSFVIRFIRQNNQWVIATVEDLPEKYRRPLL